MVKLVRLQGRCAYCSVFHTTTTNYGEARAVEVQDRHWVHFGCLIHWLIDDALTRNFPGLEHRERKALKARLNAPAADGPNLLDLNVVGRKMGWLGSMRASQVQISAMSKFHPGRTDAAEVDAAKSAAAQEVLAEAHQLMAKANELLASLTGQGDDGDRALLTP